MRLNVPGHGYYCPVQPNGLYISTENVNPSAYFPGTTWSLYAQDRFLLGAGSSYAGGATGGEAYHALTVGEMPSHSHTWYLGGRTQVGYGISGSAGSFVAGLASLSSGSVISISSEGGGAAHNNMPPYVAVYFWLRTS